MDQTSRQTEILALLDAEGACSIQTLADRFGVSDETIRRDVRQLELLGVVSKVHGGVRLPDSVLEAPYRSRQAEHSEAKQRIGEAAARLVEDGMTLFIDASTTAFWVARHLSRQRGLSVITNGLDVARELCGRNGNRVFLAGGMMSASCLSTTGQAATDFLQQFTPDLAVFGVTAIHPRMGFCEDDLAAAELVRGVLTQAHHAIAVADRSKFDRPALVRIADFRAVSTLVTDAPPPVSHAEAMAGLRVIVANGSAGVD